MKVAPSYFEPSRIIVQKFKTGLTVRREANLYLDVPDYVRNFKVNIGILAAKWTLPKEKPKATSHSLCLIFESTFPKV